MSRYLLTAEAKEDLKDIKNYLTREAGLAVAMATLAKIKSAIVLLSRTPGVGHVREDLTAEAVKFWPVLSYMIVYDPATRPVEVLRIVHGSRDFSQIILRND